MKGPHLPVLVACIFMPATTSSAFAGFVVEPGTLIGEDTHSLALVKYALNETILDTLAIDLNSMPIPNLAGLSVIGSDVHVIDTGFGKIESGHMTCRAASGARAPQNAPRSTA